MPKIPLFEQTQGMTPQGPGVLAPAVPIDTRTIGMEALAAAKGWEDLGAAGKELAEVGLRMNKALHHAKQVDMLAEAGKKSQLDLYALVERVKQEGGPETWGEKFLEEGQKIFDNVSAGISDREVLGKYKMHWSSVFPLMHHGVTTKARDVQIHQFKANILAHINDAVQMYVKEPDPIRQAQIKGLLFGRIQGGVNSLLFHPDEAEQLRQNFDKSLAETQIKIDIQANPWAVEERLQDPGKHYPTLPPGEALGFLNMARAEVHRRQETRAVEVDQLYEQKKLTFDDLKIMRGRREIGLYTYRFYEAAMQRDLLPYAVATDTNLYVDLWKKAEMGRLDPEELYRNFRGGKLEKQDAHRLMQINTQTQQGGARQEDAFTKERAFKLAVDNIQGRLEPLDQAAKKMQDVGAMRGTLAPAPPQASTEAAFYFLQACRQAKEKGELTDKFMWDKAQEIIKMYEGQPRRFGPGVGGQGGGARQTGIGVQGQKPAGGAPAPAPSGAVRILNKRTGKYEVLSPEQVNQIKTQQGGR
jgi:hypothetical protein